MFLLLMADRLGDFIVGTAMETIETEKLISEFELPQNIRVFELIAGMHIKNLPQSFSVAVNTTLFCITTAYSAGGTHPAETDKCLGEAVPLRANRLLILLFVLPNLNCSFFFTSISWWAPLFLKPVINVFR